MVVFNFKPILYFYCDTWGLQSSGILCIIIEKVMERPRLRSLLVVMKVTIPSGILWIPRQSIVIRPILFKLLSLGNILLKQKDKVIPKVKNSNVMIKLSEKL